MKVKNIFLIFSLMFAYNLNAKTVEDNMRKYRSPILTLQNSIINHKTMSGLFAGEILVSNSIDNQIDLENKENAFLVEKSEKDIAQKSDLLILKNESLNIKNEFSLTGMKKR